MAQLKTVIFDFDGTIADTFDELVSIITTHAKEWGLPALTKEEFEKFRNAKSQDALKSLGIPVYKVPFLVLKIRNELHKSLDKLAPIDGISTTIKELAKKGLKLGILTSNSKENVLKFLEAKGIQGMDFVYTNSNLWGKDKSLVKMIKDLKLNIEDILYIGDETRDIEASKKVGVKVCAVTWGFQSESILKSLGPDFIVNKPDELLAIG